MSDIIVRGTIDSIQTGGTVHCGLNASPYFGSLFNSNMLSWYIGVYKDQPKNKALFSPRNIPCANIFFFAEKNKNHLFRWAFSPEKLHDISRGLWSDGEPERMPCLIWVFTWRVIKPTQNRNIPNLITEFAVVWEEQCKVTATLYFS